MSTDLDSKPNTSPSNSYKPNKEEKLVIEALTQNFWETGTLIGLQKLSELVKLPYKKVEMVYDKPEVRNILNQSGINLPELNRDTLTAQQLTTVDVLLNFFDKRSTREKLEQVGVTTQKLNVWLRDESFQRYIRTRSNQLLGSTDFAAKRGLAEAVESGDLNAIKFYLEYSGQYNPRVDINARFDVNLILTRVVEIISQLGLPGEKLEWVAGELDKLVEVKEVKELER